MTEADPNPPRRPASRPVPKPERKKRGFYARHFRQVEINDLDVLSADLQDEIAGLRVAGRRILELSGEMKDPLEAIRALGAYGAMCQRIARLLQVHHEITGGSSDNLALLQEVISSVLAEKQKTGFLPR